MKKVLLKLAFVVMAVAALVSCKKENTLSDSVSNNSVNDAEFVTPNMEGQLRQMPYGHIVAALEEEYGCCFDFDDIDTAVTPSGVLAANLLVLPSLYFENDFLTIIINGSAQLLGVYEVRFTSGFNNSICNVDRGSYSFDIFYDTNNIFSGYVYTNVLYYPDRINAYGTPSGYPYPLLNYYSTGYINLETCVPAPSSTSRGMALKLASSFYIHYYLDN